jgi:hypothetical protein
VIKVVDENPNKEEELKSGDYPLSPADWVMLLSRGISDRLMRFLAFATMNMGSMFVALGGTIALMISSTIKSTIASYIVLILWVYC